MITNFWRRLHGTFPAKKLRIKDILKEKVIDRKPAVIHGWVRSIRQHKRVVFIDVNDGSTMKCLQVVVSPEKFKSGLSYGASLEARGEIVATKHHRDGLELLCDEISWTGPCDETYPFIKHSSQLFQYQRTLPHLRMKEDAMASVLRTRNCLEMNVHKYFQENGFLHVHTPTLTSSDCEGAGAMFEVITENIASMLDEDEEPSLVHQESDIKSNPLTVSSKNNFFGNSAYLTVSSQLHLEACALGIGDVYTLSPTFRAESSTTKKHLSEFRMLEVEVTFSQSLDDLLNLMEESIKFILSNTYETCWSEQSYFFKKLTELHKSIVTEAAVKKYARLTYTEALDILENNQKRLDSIAPSWGDDINSEQERFLVNYCDNLPVFITDFPSISKPFYMLANPDQKTVSAVDLIFPFCGELCGGSRREHRLDVLSSRLDSLGMKQDYNWYLDLRRYGNVPHAGYGMGFDRLVQFVLGINNIRDAVPFPRSPNFCVL